MELQKSMPPGEIEQNTRCKRIFTEALISMDVHLLEDCLHEFGSFFGMDKHGFLCYMNSLFVAIQKEYYGSALRQGVCLDEIAGGELIEIRYAMCKSLLNDEGYYIPKPKTAAGEHEKSLIFTFSFRGGLIEYILKSKHYVFKDSIPCFDETCILN
jgi:hypothetical protein